MWPRIGSAISSVKDRFKKGTPPPEDRLRRVTLTSAARRPTEAPSGGFFLLSKRADRRRLPLAPQLHRGRRRLHVPSSVATSSTSFRRWTSPHRAGHAKDRANRGIPISTRPRKVLEAWRDSSTGMPLPPSVHVFGDEVGGQVESVRRASQTAVYEHTRAHSAPKEQPLLPPRPDTHPRTHPS